MAHPSTSNANGIWDISQVELYIRAAQWPAGGGGPTDPDFANVELLLHGDGTNGSTSIADSSGSPKTVTAYGNAAISTSQSKFGGASIAFDGNNDYLKVSDSGLAIGTNDFTLEAFFFWAGDTAVGTVSDSALVDFRTASSDANIYIGVAGSTNAGPKAYLYVSGQSVIVPGSTVSSNTWNHLALVRSGTTTTLYLNGSSQGGWTDTNNYSGTEATVGGRFADVSGDYRSFNGYIDEFRLTIGTARYTANFTPPTAAFPDS